MQIPGLNLLYEQADSSDRLEGQHQSTGRNVNAKDDGLNPLTGQQAARVPDSVTPELEGDTNLDDVGLDVSAQDSITNNPAIDPLDMALAAETYKQSGVVANKDLNTVEVIGE